jgi:hypothetical protein
MPIVAIQSNGGRIIMNGGSIVINNNDLANPGAVGIQANAGVVYLNGVSIQTNDASGQAVDVTLGAGSVVLANCAANVDPTQANITVIDPVANIVPTTPVTVSDASVAAIDTAVWSDTQTYPAGSKGAELKAAGSAVINVVVSPIQATVQIPRIATQNISVGQGETVPFTWIIVDATGTPVNLNGASLTFNAWTSPDAGATKTIVITYTTSNFIVISGANYNNVTVTFQSADVLDANAVYSYSLANVTGGPYLLCQGTLRIMPAVV